MNEEYSRLRRSFTNGPTISKNGYSYYVNPICDGVPLTGPELLKEAITGLLQICEFDCDAILAPEAMGIALAAGVSLCTGIPYGVIRKREYGLTGEIAVPRSTGYSSDCLYINGVKAGDRVVIVDDILSTGGTLRAIIKELTARGIEVVEVAVVYAKQPASKVLPGVNVKVLVDNVV